VHRGLLGYDDVLSLVGRYQCSEEHNVFILFTQDLNTDHIITSANLHCVAFSNPNNNCKTRHNKEQRGERIR
jgi:hypothetical protein